MEWPADLTRERYAKVLAGTLPPSRNEVVQVGFRLAQRVGLKEVNGIDVAGEFPYEAVAAFAKAHGQEGLLAGSYRSVTSEEDAAFVGERLRTVTNVRNNLPSIGRMLVAGLTQSST